APAVASAPPLAEPLLLTRASAANPAIVPMTALALPRTRMEFTRAQWAMLLWSVGVVALLLARAFAYGRFVRALQRTRTEAEPALACRMRETARGWGVDRIQVSVTDLVSVPALHGLKRPHLLFPRGFLERLNPGEIEF